MDLSPSYEDGPLLFPLFENMKATASQRTKKITLSLHDRITSRCSKFYTLARRVAAATTRERSYTTQTTSRGELSHDHILMTHFNEVYDLNFRSKADGLMDLMGLWITKWHGQGESI